MVYVVFNVVLSETLYAGDSTSRSLLQGVGVQEEERKERGREKRMEDNRGRGRMKFHISATNFPSVGCPYLGTRPTPTAVGMSPWALLLGEPVPTSGSNLTYRLWRARTLGYMKGGQSINILSTIWNLALPHQCWRRSPAPDNPYPTVQLEES